MGETVNRKCRKCGKTMTIERDNIGDIVHFQNGFYHTDCFIEAANKNAIGKTGKPTAWKRALDNLDALREEAVAKMDYYWRKEDLNKWILAHYDITIPPVGFWSEVAALEQGKYGRKSCNPVSIDTLLAMWKWGQKNLDKINAKNKANNKGPKDDNARLRYDMSILLNHRADYIKYITRTKEEASEIAARIENANKFDYEKIYKESKKQEAQSDILDLMNEIF